MLDIIALVLVLTAALAYLNHRFVGLPTTIGVMGIALLLSGADGDECVRTERPARPAGRPAARDRLPARS
ncbi:hypothetical protein LP420_38900 [Massilia sp. B-10]|nr:hypothetical protein LP420_38900 [Massilia sp. B-10]